MDRTDAGGRRLHDAVVAGYQSRGRRIAGVIFTGVWLLYLIGPVVDLFSGHHSTLYVAGGLTIIVVFSALYLVLVPSWPAPLVTRCPVSPCSPRWPPPPA